MPVIAALLIGMVFGSGILLGGMANPAKVLNFFDIAGTWDPSLAFVILGALAVAGPGYRFILRRRRPVFDTEFHLPPRRGIDLRLFGGASLFGIGWGIAGFCPGGAIPALGLLRPEPLVFLIAMSAGILIAHRIQGRIADKIGSRE
ncbi:DUF6691 family protein [Paracoccus sp. IB05]|uniref:DUF6691 family protein n=1 Tax=Paracoccus sp. IB05 TaxID=2779367 RepID=UPI0018E7CA4D|nr:DUF6691 family protein [Paracoccus sp. IB05]MBJ2152241.1 YeeE/YedE family protein [Paracoccus sp. IB05]